MRIQTQALLKEVGEVVEKDSYKFQVVLLGVTYFDPMTGEPGPEQLFEAVIFNKKVEALRASSLVGKRVIVSLYLRSNSKDYNGRTFHNLSLYCANIKEVPND